MKYLLVIVIALGLIGGGLYYLVNLNTTASPSSEGLTTPAPTSTYGEPRTVAVAVTKKTVPSDCTGVVSVGELDQIYGVNNLSLQQKPSRAGLSACLYTTGNVRAVTYPTGTLLVSVSVGPIPPELLAAAQRAALKDKSLAIPGIAGAYWLEINNQKSSAIILFKDDRTFTFGALDSKHDVQTLKLAGLINEKY